VIKKLFASINPKSKEEIAAAIKNLAGFQGKAEKHKSILYIFEANLRLSLGNLDVAKSLFLKGLTQAPYLASAYVDLGKLLYREYDMPGEWSCWDTARKIAPDYNLLQEVNDKEAFYESRYPEYFNLN
jgi:tetratricopeptide (TPR) repeat protein